MDALRDQSQELEALAAPTPRNRITDLGLQGGPMNRVEAAAFAGRPYARDAITLRRLDEAAKDPDAEVPGFDHYRALLIRLLEGPQGA